MNAVYSSLINKEGLELTKFVPWVNVEVPILGRKRKDYKVLFWIYGTISKNIQWVVVEEKNLSADRNDKCPSSPREKVAKEHNTYTSF